MRTRSPVGAIGEAGDVAGGEDARPRWSAGDRRPPRRDRWSGPAAWASSMAGLTPTPSTTRSAPIRSPLASTHGVRLDARRRLAEVEANAVLLVDAAQEAPARGPATCVNGMASGATTSTVRSRARSEAATSMPMKLAPMTTARLAFAGAGDDGPAVGQRAQRVDVRQIGARQRRPDRLGARRQQQRVPGDLRPSSSDSVLAAGSIAATASPERQGDLLFAEERGGAQRHPLLGRGAGQVVLGQVRAIDRRRLVGAEQEDLTVVAFAAQRLGRRLAGRPGADDGDGPQRRFAPQARADHRAGPPTRILPPGALDVVAGQGIEGRRAQHRARAQDRSRRGARGSGSCRRPPAPRPAGRRSACRWRRRRRSPRRSGPAARTRRSPGRAADPRPERQSPRYRPRDLDPRAWFLHPWALAGRVAGTGRGDKAPLSFDLPCGGSYWRRVRRLPAGPGSRRRLVLSRAGGVVVWRSSPLALPAPRRQFSLGLQPVVGLVPRHRPSLKEKLVGPPCDFVLARGGSAASSIGLRH